MLEEVKKSARRVFKRADIRIKRGGKAKMGEYGMTGITTVGGTGRERNECSPGEALWTKLNLEEP